MVRVNGEDRDAAGLTVSALLEDAGFDAARVVVEKNGEIVQKGGYDSETLSDGDVVEVISFMGGGSAFLS